MGDYDFLGEPGPTSVAYGPQTKEPREISADAASERARIIALIRGEEARNLLSANLVSNPNDIPLAYDTAEAALAAIAELIERE